jgi:hypothetical protein
VDVAHEAVSIFRSRLWWGIDSSPVFRPRRHHERHPNEVTSSPEEGVVVDDQLLRDLDDDARRSDLGLVEKVDEGLAPELGVTHGGG